MYPSKQKPYSGIFVKNQYEALLSALSSKDKIDIYAMPRKYSSKIGSVLKYFRAFFKFIPFFKEV